jgi:hypothetical protein
MKYRLKGAIAGEIPVMGHRFAFDFAANRTTPQSEQDEEAMEYLVSIGWAERVPETKTDEARIETEEQPPPEPAPTEEEK